MNLNDLEAILGGSVVLIMLLGFIGIIISFIPTFIAFARKMPYKWIVLIINLTFGWTGIGWIILLIYTLFPNNKTIIDPLIDPTGTSIKNGGAKE